MNKIERMKLVMQLWNEDKSVKQIQELLGFESRQGVYWYITEWHKLMTPVDNALDIRKKRTYTKGIR